MNLEMLKSTLISAKAGGFEYVTVFYKGDSSFTLEFAQRHEDYYSMMRERSRWKSLDYHPKRVYDLFYIDPEEIEEV